MATTTEVMKNHLWLVPERWSLEDAATVPYVYSTAYLALVEKGCIRRSQYVLIHLGGTPVGQAAVAVALQHNCEVFIAISSDQQRAMFKERFPQLRNQNFVDDNSPTFHLDVLRNSDGKQMDLIFGAIAAEKLNGSLKIVEQSGVLVELGKVRPTEELGLV